MTGLGVEGQAAVKHIGAAEAQQPKVAKPKTKCRANISDILNDELETQNVSHSRTDIPIVMKGDTYARTG